MNNMRTTLAFALVAAMLLTGNAAEPGQPPRGKPVLCWYMVCYHTTVEHYMEEMALAQAHGVDAFLLDISGAAYKTGKKAGEVEETNYGLALTRMYEAAQRLGTGFKLALTPESYIAKAGLGLNVQEMVHRFIGHPNYFHYDGQPLFVSYIGRPGSWARPLAELREEEGIDPLWIGFFGNSRWSMIWSPEIIEGFFQESEDLDGLINFGVNATAVEVNNNSNARRTTAKLGKVFAASVNPTYNSSNVIDRRGMDGYGALWEGAVRDGADMVGIVIWNDYNEDSNLFPGRWPFGSQKHYVSRDESFLDVTAYYSAWFRTGVQPTIPQDKFYAVYRNRTKWQDRGWDPEKQQWVRIRNKPYPYDQFHDDNEDQLYVTAFLTAPAELTVALGKTQKTESLPAGIRTVAIPLAGGVPHFTLRRGNEVLADVVGGRQVIAKETKTNSAVESKGKHLLYRNFTYGTAIGPVATSLSASDAKLLGNAEYADLKTGWFGGKTVGVQTKPEEGSGLELPVSGLKTATYNLRITYSNPDADDARLTLTVDGGRSEAASDKDETYERILPVSFPPTGEGKLATTSLLWSLFDNTTSLTFDYQLGTMFQKPDPAGDDRGSVFIEKIELIEVLPTAVPALHDFTVPELVNIPSGGFTMGTDKGNPDEAPARKVTLSPFAIGKYEITNEQFEKFMPEHRQFRDQYSWRDRDPVIYVKWTEAAVYCNWLSKQQALEPVYDEKSWEADHKKNGYRLPSEAQWEYVAAGRDENRRYVWGGNDPGQDSCHAARARGEAPNPIPRVVPAVGYLPGVVPVGSFANDRSRDGVMDLGGNVAEWCGDWFDDYAAADRQDPFQGKESAPKYRAIRGGSWGYYNYSLRVVDREYNTQVYPGYVYIGFRVARPVAE